MINIFELKAYGLVPDKASKPWTYLFYTGISPHPQVSQNTKAPYSNEKNIIFWNFLYCRKPSKVLNQFKQQIKMFQNLVAVWGLNDEALNHSFLAVLLVGRVSRLRKIEDVLSSPWDKCNNMSRRALESQRTKGTARGGNKTVLCVVDNVPLTYRGKSKTKGLFLFSWRRYEPE
jgi:hypothetical protein